MDLNDDSGTQDALLIRVLNGDIEMINPKFSIALKPEEREYIATKSLGGESFIFHHSSGVYRCASYGDMVVCLNITDMVKKSENNQRKLRELERRYDNMMRFSDLIIHDVKNYIFILDGFLNLMENGDASTENVEEMKKAIDKIRELIKKASLLIKDSTNIRKVEINLEAMMEDVLSKLKINMQRKNISHEMLCEVREIRTDTLLEEVIYNLIQNAIEHSPEGGTIRIECFLNGAKTIIKIRDEGPGIPDDLKDMIFERFKTTSTGFGMGLGLAVAKHIVSLLGGDIWVEDNEPRGAVFVISIPGK